MIKKISVKIKLGKEQTLESKTGKLDIQSGKIFWGNTNLNETPNPNQRIKKTNLLLSRFTTLSEINKGIAGYIQKKWPTYQDQYEISIKIY